VSVNIPLTINFTFHGEVFMVYFALHNYIIGTFINP